MVTRGNTVAAALLTLTLVACARAASETDDITGKGASSPGAGGAGNGGNAAGGPTTGGTSAVGGTSSSGGGGGNMATGGAAPIGGAGGVGNGGNGGSSPIGTTITEWNFATCPSAWTAAGMNSDWACGAPSSGPNADHSGDGNVWATNLGGNANTCARATLTSPVVDLSSCVGDTVKVSFWHWFDFRECTCFCGLSPNESDSGGAVQVNSGAGWVTLNPEGGYDNGGDRVNCAGTDYCSDASCAIDESMNAFTSAGAEGSWQFVTVDVSAHATASFQVRFYYGSHAGFGCFPSRPGWYVDDVRVFTTTGC